MEYGYNVKRLYWIFGIFFVVFMVVVIFYTTGFFKNINEATVSSIVSYISENAHTGLDKSPGAQMAFTEPEKPTQYAVIVPRVEKPVVAMGEGLQLFDINMELDSTSVFKVDDLGLRVNFNNFGEVVTPVDMTFEILDSNGKVVYSKTESLIVETEQVYNKSFAGFILNPGDYTIKLTTLYGNNVKDEFIHSFEVKSSFSWATFRLYVAGLIAIIIIVILFLPKKYYLKRKNG